MAEHVKIGNRRIWMHKSIQHTDFESESVLSSDPWLFVELWLKRNRKNDALAYWIQARRFSDSAQNLGVEAAPLPLYYSMLNATKALLIVRSATHGNTHGVSGGRPENAKASLANEKVKFHSGGVLSAFCKYYGESVGQNDEYDLRGLLWNLPFVHRAFRHTYRSSAELFIPIESACYVKKEKSSESWFQAQVVPRYTDKRLLRHIPTSFEVFEQDGRTFIRRKKRFKWINGRTNAQEKARALNRLCNYHSSTRRLIIPISGSRDLWYFKKSFAGNALGQRHSLPIIFAAMHRFSELSRYHPNGFERHLSGSANWLISEFIEHAGWQFIDQISSEITGLQFWRPGIRS